MEFVNAFFVLTAFTLHLSGIFYVVVFFILILSFMRDNFVLNGLCSLLSRSEVQYLHKIIDAWLVQEGDLLRMGLLLLT